MPLLAMVGFSAQVAALLLMAESQHGPESSLVLASSVPPRVPDPYPLEGEGNSQLLRSELD